MSDGATPGVGVMMGDAGACPEIPFKGKTYKVGHPTQAAKGRLEKLAAKVAIDEVRALKGTLDPEAYRETFEGVTKNLKSYRTWQPGWQAVVFDPQNSYLFLWSLMQEFYPDLSGEVVQAICEAAPEEVQAALAQVIPDFFGMLLADLSGRLTPEQNEKIAAALEQVRQMLTRQTHSTESGKP